MYEYIEREALKKSIIEKANPVGYTHIIPQDVYSTVLSIVECEAAVDVSEIMRGEWISVKDRLPEAEQEVLILTENGVITTAMYEDGTIYMEDSCWIWYDVDFDYDEENDKYIICEGWWEYRHYNPDEVYNNCVDDKVTHWMPLPEPPKEVVEGAANNE